MLKAGSERNRSYPRGMPGDPVPCARFTSCEAGVQASNLTVCFRQCALANPLNTGAQELDQRKLPPSLWKDFECVSNSTGSRRTAGIN